MNTQRVKPLTTDPDTAPFWEAAAQQRLVVRFCRSCDAPVHLPRALCPRCHGPAEEWREVAGRGTVHSWTVVEHQVHPGHPTPYTVVLIDLEDYPSVRMLGAIDDRVDVSIGQAVAVHFENIGDATLPQWRPVEA